MKTRGLVVELELNEAVIMSETGEFVICNPQPGMEIGAIVEVSLWEQKQVWRRLKVGFSGAAVFFFGLLLGLGLYYNRNNQVYAYLDVDHDSSLTLALNRELKITEVRPLNARAKHLLQKEQFKGKPVREALALLVGESLASRKGPTAPDAVLVAIAIKQTGKPAGQGEAQQLLSRIGGSIPRRIQKADYPAVNVKTVVVSSNDGKAARQMKLSMGKYYYYQKVKGLGARFTAKEVRGLSAGRLIKGLEQLEAGCSPDCNCGPVCEKCGAQPVPGVKSGAVDAQTAAQRGAATVVSRRNPGVFQTRADRKPEQHAGSQRNVDTRATEADPNRTENSAPKPKRKFRWFAGPGYVPANQGKGTGDGGNAASTSGESGSGSSTGSGSQTSGSGGQSCNGNCGSGNSSGNGSSRGSGRGNGR